LVGSGHALLHQGWLFVARLLLDQDPWKQLENMATASNSGGAKSKEPTPRTLSWSDVAPVEQAKWVAETLSRGNEKSITINDIFVSCVTAALAKQLQYHRERLQMIDEQAAVLPKQKHMHVAVPVHLKGGVVLPEESVGNNIGAFVIRVPGEMGQGGDSLSRLRAVSGELHTIKGTPAAFLSHMLAKTLSYASSTILPVAWTSKLYAAANAGSLCVVSNNRGSPVKVHMAGRQVESLYGFVPLPPGIPVGVTIMSYAGNLNCTVAAEPWAIPDGDQFVVWVLEEYLRLVAAAKQVKKTRM